MGGRSSVGCTEAILHVPVHTIYKQICPNVPTQHEEQLGCHSGSYVNLRRWTKVDKIVPKNTSS